MRAAVEGGSRFLIKIFRKKIISNIIYFIFGASIELPTKQWQKYLKDSLSDKYRNRLFKFEYFRKAFFKPPQSGLTQPGNFTYPLCNDPFNTQVN